jgi:glycosyltransferase involved in cell wall biosynthesis
VRIIHTITKLEFGGAQQNTLYTLNNLPDNYEGYLLCGKGGLLDEEAVRSQRFIVRFCPFLKREISPLYDFLTFTWMYFYFLGLKPDMIHSHSSKAGILSRWSARFAGVKRIVHTYHGFGFTPLQAKLIRKFFISLEKFSAKISDKLVAVANANVITALSVGVGKKEQYKVIRSGIDFRCFEKTGKFANIRREIELEDNKKIIGNVSCFKPQKGLFDYIKVCRLLKNKGDYNFILVGDGKLRPQLERRVVEAGLKDCFFMLGWRRDAHRIISAFDVMLHTAYFEGLARVFLEAMACEVPIVATAVDGALDVVENGINGYLADPGDIEGLAEYTHKLLEDDNLRIKMGEEGKKKLKEEFDISVMSDMVNKLYKDLERNEIVK